MGVGRIIKRIVREVIEKIVVTKKGGNKTYLLKDEKAYIDEKSETYEANIIPRDIQTLTDELQ